MIFEKIHILQVPKFTKLLAQTLHYNNILIMLLISCLVLMAGYTLSCMCILGSAAF